MKNTKDFQAYIETGLTTEEIAKIDKKSRLKI